MRGIILSLLGIVASSSAAALGEDDKAAVEALVRQSESAVATLDCGAIDSALAPGARWIEKSYPLPAESAEWCNSARAAGVRIAYQLHDFDVQIHGDVSWVTVVIDGSFYAGTPDAKALMFHEPTDPAEWHSTAVESIVLLKIDGHWKMVLGHSSVIPQQGG